jgi:aryl-alcohol dehydrogenase-like predicted oxidoreductase
MPAMRYRRLGSTDLTVSEVGFGCARIGGFLQGGDRADGVRLLRSALDHGITLFDTSSMYTQGESERRLGEAFAGARESVVIATKAGYVLPAQRRLLAPLKPLLRPLIRRTRLSGARLPPALRGALSQDFSPAHLIRSAEQSLRRLRTDRIDLLQLHSPPSEMLENGDILEPLERLRQEGKVRHYGVSCETTADALLCLRLPGISSIQVRLSLLDGTALAEALPRAAQRELGVIARECYAGGLLSRSPTGVDLATVVAEGPSHRQALDRLRDCERLASEFGRPLPELALHFVLAQPGVSVTLLGMRHQAHLAGNLVHLAAPALEAEEMRRSATAGLGRSCAASPPAPPPAAV